MYIFKLENIYIHCVALYTRIVIIVKNTFFIRFIILFINLSFSVNHSISKN